MATGLATRAVLLVGHGTVRNTRDVPEFLRRIRRGREPSDALIQEIRRRYDYIGGSPLLSVTERVGSALETELGIPVRVAMRFWHPFIEDVVADLVEERIQEVYILPVAPFSVHIYAGAVADAMSHIASRLGQISAPGLRPVSSYGQDRELVKAQADQIAPLLERRDPGKTALILTAHSLPVHVLTAGDPYQRHFEAAARAIGSELGWPGIVAYQSQGEGGGEWVGPSIAEVLRNVSESGKREVVVAPVGFLADHVETLFDLDVEAKATADALGLEFVRVPALNDSPALIHALAAVVRRALA